jgi:hypothetical protein
MLRHVNQRGSGHEKGTSNDDRCHGIGTVGGLCHGRIKGRAIVFWPIFIYVVASAAIAITAGMGAGFWVALHVGGGSLLALSAGGGLRASLRGDRTQKIAGSLIALGILGLALWVSEGFSARLFGIYISGPIWAAIGFVVCLVFADKKLTA